MVKIDIDDAICLVIVKRKVDTITDKDTAIVLTPANVQDAMRISKALSQAQKTLIEITQRAVVDGVRRQVEN